MPKSKSDIFQITAAFVEFIHDELVAKYWGFDQPVSGDEFRDPTLIDSAVHRPFQSYGGVEFYPGIYSKAGPLFHSLICNHPFRNGNKRTAVISVDAFLTANGIFLALMTRCTNWRTTQRRIMKEVCRSKSSWTASQGCSESFQSRLKSWPTTSNTKKYMRIPEMAGQLLETTRLINDSGMARPGHRTGGGS